MIQWTPEFNPAASTEPVVVAGMPASVYHAAPGLNASKVAPFAHSTLQGVYEMGKPKEPTMDMRLGTAIHTRLLEPKDFALRAQEFEEIGPQAVAKMADFESRHPDTLVLAKGWTARIDGIRNAVVAHPFANEIIFGLKDAARELSVFWVEEIYGEPIRCKARLDYIHAEKRLIVDLKSTNDADPSAFNRKIADLDYHIKGAWYCRAARVAGLAPNGIRMAWIALETTAPYRVQPIQASDAMLEQGDALAGLGAHRYAAHMLGRPDPYPPPLVALADLPPWHTVDPESLQHFNLRSIA